MWGESRPWSLLSGLWIPSLGIWFLKRNPRGQNEKEHTSDRTSNSYYCWSTDRQLGFLGPIKLLVPSWADPSSYGACWVVPSVSATRYQHLSKNLNRPLDPPFIVSHFLMRPACQFPDSALKMPGVASLPLNSKSFIFWCRGRESNPHARCQAQDFKSYVVMPLSAVNTIFIN